MLVVATACGRAEAPTVDGPSPSPSPSVADPTGVLVWIRDGASSWPPQMWALPLAGGEAAQVDLSAVERAVDWSWAPDLSRRTCVTRLLARRLYSRRQAGRSRSSWRA